MMDNNQYKEHQVPNLHDPLHQESIQHSLFSEFQHYRPLPALQQDIFHEQQIQEPQVIISEDTGTQPENSPSKKYKSTFTTEEATKCVVPTVPWKPHDVNYITSNASINKPRFTVKAYGKQVSSSFSQHLLNSSFNCLEGTKHLHAVHEQNQANFKVGPRGPPKSSFTLPFQLDCAPQFLAGNFTVVSQTYRVSSLCQEDILLCSCLDAVVEWDTRVSARLTADVRSCKGNRCQFKIPDTPLIHISSGVPYQSC